MILIDSNVWIFAEIANSPENSLAVDGYKKYLKTDKVAVNPIIISEVFHKLSVLFDKDIAFSKVAKILQNPSIEWLDMHRETASEAIKLAKETGIRINDAMIGAQALERKAKVLTDDIKDFRKLKNLETIPLRSAVHGKT